MTETNDETPEIDYMMMDRFKRMPEAKKAKRYLELLLGSPTEELEAAFRNVRVGLVMVAPLNPPHYFLLGPALVMKRIDMILNMRREGKTDEAIAAFHFRDLAYHVEEPESHIRHEVAWWQSAPRKELGLRTMKR